MLQTSEFERLGSNQSRRVRVRLIAATNTNLRQAIREGRFREDLYFRLNVIELELPPLAERREDILLLARHFLDPDFSLSPDAERSLARHGWPGNVRELRNMMQRAALLATGPEITGASLGLPVSRDDLVCAADEVQIDRETIEQALARSAGVVAHAARDLGLSRQALYRRMEKLGLKSTA